MSYEPIQRLEIENYGCIRKLSLCLSPLHALIGPNDSGKSTVLRALRTAAKFAGGQFDFDGDRRPLPFDPMIDTRTSGSSIGLHYADRLSYVLRNEEGVTESVYDDQREVVVGTKRSGWSSPGVLGQKEPPAVAALANRLTPATMVRFDPNELRRPAPQILSHESIRFADETGAGLASVYQAINSRDVDAFVTIRDAVRRLFPTIRTILVPTIAQGQVVLQTKLIDGTLVDTPAISEGLLYFLGYAALRYLSDTRLFLVEEPENGLHPVRIAEVMAILREISRSGQVVVATHSPLVVNELQGHEVTVLTRDPQTGTQARLLSEVPRFQEASKVYEPGEFWLSYADGNQETPLLTGTPRT